MFIQPLKVEPAQAPGVEPLEEVRAVFAHFPDGLAAFDQMYARMVGQGRLDPTLRLVLLASSARWRSDSYTAGAFYRRAIDHGLEAAALGELVAEVEAGQASTSAAGLLAFCRKVTESAFKTVAADVAAVRDHGWSTGQITEAVTMVSLSGYISAMAAAGGFVAAASDEEGEPWR